MNIDETVKRKQKELTRLPEVMQANMFKIKENYNSIDLLTHLQRTQCTTFIMNAHRVVSFPEI